jgi:hypothetical protein
MEKRKSKNPFWPRELFANTWTHLTPQGSILVAQNKFLGVFVNSYQVFEYPSLRNCH